MAAATDRLDTAAPRWQFRSFRARLLSFLSLLLLSLLAIIYLAVTRSSYRNTLDNIEAALEVSQEVFRQSMADRAEAFRTTGRVLLSDFAFLTVYNRGDPATILSACENILVRMGNADNMMVLDLQRRVVADTMGIYPTGTQAPWGELLDEAEANTDFQASGIVLLEGAPYQIVVVPVSAPILQGWVILGRELNEAFVAGLSGLTNSEISIVTQMADQNVRLQASSLADEPGQDLQGSLEANGLVGAGISILPLAGEDYVSLNEPLVSRPGFQVAALIQRSLNQALAPYYRLESRLILLFALTLVLSLVLAVWLARSVSRPVRSLVGKVRKIESGDFSASREVRRSDEIGELANSLNGMARGLAEREKVRDLLGKVVSREVAEELLSREITLGGEEKEVAVLFCDVCNFTTLSENMSPHDVLALLNRYLSRITAVIESRQGVVDKFIGDAAMALFGAPLSSGNDVQNALLTALEVHQAVRQLNLEWSEAGQPPLEIGVGLHVGRVVAGNLGSDNRLNYTVIGDTVNLSARLESLTRYYGVDIIVSEQVIRQSHGLQFRELDRVRVKGRQQAVTIFELLGQSGQVADACLAESRHLQAFLDLYRNQDWQEALKRLDELGRQFGEQALYRIYRDRIEYFQVNNPGPDWEGVFSFDTK